MIGLLINKTKQNNGDSYITHDSSFMLKWDFDEIINCMWLKLKSHLVEMRLGWTWTYPHNIYEISSKDSKTKKDKIYKLCT